MAAKTTLESIKRIHYLAAALKAPRITESAQRLAEQPRDAGWTHEDSLAAVLEREVSARNAPGAELRIRAPISQLARPWKTSTSTPSPPSGTRPARWRRRRS